MSDNNYKKVRDSQNGCSLIGEERARQEQRLGRTAKHDDLYIEEELRNAAIAYAMVCDERADKPPSCWPFEADAFSSSGNKVENLIKAGALIAAEIDRHHRIFQKACNEITSRDFGFACFDEMDAYDLLMLDWVGIAPEEYIRIHFKTEQDNFVEDLVESFANDE